MWRVRGSIGSRPADAWRAGACGSCRSAESDAGGHFHWGAHCRRVAGDPGLTFRRPTIREVATLAGVSVGTVSNVLTSRRGVRPETRAKIDAAIRELGFVPDLAARSLIARRARARPRPDPAAPRLTCVGYVCADHTARVAVLPHRDDRATARDITKTLGGCAANVAVTAAGLGPPFPVAVDVLSVLGDDPDSDWAAALLAERRVELGGIAPNWHAPLPLHHPGRSAWRPNNRQRAAAGPSRQPGALAGRGGSGTAPHHARAGRSDRAIGGSAAAGPRSWPATRHPHHTPAAGVALAGGPGEIVRPV